VPRKNLPNPIAKFGKRKIRIQRTALLSMRAGP
jgi:hypothetical protein